MNYYKMLSIILVGVVLLTKSVEICAAETEKHSQPLLSFLLYSKGSGQMEVVDDKIESVRISSGDAITFVCTTEKVHLWDGKIDHGKFWMSMRTIQRNSTGYFTSSVSIRLRKLPIQDSSIGFTQNYLKCYELEKEKRKRATCIYLNDEQNGKSKSNRLVNVNANEKREEFSVSLDSCPRITAEEENEYYEAEIPEWLWKAENNSVLCHVDSPSRMELKSVSCDNPSWCNLRRYCTVQTCPSFVATAPPCENLCNRQTMQVNFVSGQLQCEANGFSTNLNFVTGFDNKMCYLKPHHSVSFCQVLDLDIPDPGTDIFHGQPLKLYGRASKFVIMQEPEVHIILSTGQVLKPKVHIVTELKDHRKYPYFVFMINTTANSKTELIKVIGHRYDSNHLVVIKKQLNIKDGVRPEIRGLPTYSTIANYNSVKVLPFTIVGFPDPEIVLSYNEVVVGNFNPWFGLCVNDKGQKSIKIHSFFSNYSGQLKISANNILGHHDVTIYIQVSIPMSRAEACGISAVLACLILLSGYLVLKIIEIIHDQIIPILCDALR